MPESQTISYRLTSPIREAFLRRVEATQETPTEVLDLALRKLLKLW